MGILGVLIGKKAPVRTKSYHKKFHLRGINFECKKDKNMQRQEVLQSVFLNRNTRVHLERYLYKGKPAYMVVLDKNNLDIGVVPDEMVDKVEKYNNRDYSLEIIRIYDIDDKKEGVELLFQVFKDEK